MTQIEIKLNTLTDQLRQSREEEDIFESDVRQWKKQLDKSSDISRNQGRTPLITQIYVTVTFSKCNRHLVNLSLIFIFTFIFSICRDGHLFEIYI